MHRCIRPLRPSACREARASRTFGGKKARDSVSWRVLKRRRPADGKAEANEPGVVTKPICSDSASGGRRALLEVCRADLTATTDRGGRRGREVDLSAQSSTAMRSASPDRSRTRARRRFWRRWKDRITSVADGSISSSMESNVDDITAGDESARGSRPYACATRTAVRSGEQDSLNDIVAARSRTPPHSSR